jgi:hypothetical protein
MSDKMEEVENIPETNDDESDSDEDMDDGDAKNNERIKELEGVLKENPYDYQVRVLLKNISNLSSLRGFET